MNNRILSAGLLCIIFPLSTRSNTTEKPKDSAPNIVFLLADDCTYWDIGCYGSSDAITPNIDKLAAEGMKFTKFYQAAPMCSPTRHNLYTGIYPVRTGAYPNHTFVYPGTKTIIDYLEPLGYRVALSGKRHIAPEEIFRFEYLGNGNNLDFRKVDNFISNASNNNEPFCLFLCSNEPHSPWNLGNPEKYNPDSIILPPFMVDTKETRKDFIRYLAEIEYLDSQVGEALDLLARHGAVNNTVFIFSSEQGNSFPFAKWTCYDAGLHTAFIVKYPAVVKPGAISEVLADYTDVVPTLIDIAGGNIPKYIDGKSLLPILKGKPFKHKKYSFGLQTSRGIHSGPEQFAIRSVRDGKHSLIINLNHDKIFTNNITERENEFWLSWKKEALTDSFAKQQVTAYQHRPPVELFDISADPFNMNNLADDPRYSKTRKKLQWALEKWMDYCGDNGIETEIKAKERSWNLFNQSL